MNILIVVWDPQVLMITVCLTYWLGRLCPEAGSAKA